MPLATLLRPRNLDEFVGQEQLVGPSGPLRKLIENENIPSMIFWGPPATGKTTLAEIIALSVNAEFLRLSAVMNGKDDLKKVIKEAEYNKKSGRRTILFIDEIHRWSKTQQDALLPFVEQGDVTLIGATTENPSFTVISALISRCRVFVFQPLTIQNIKDLLKNAINILNSKGRRAIYRDILNFDKQTNTGDILSLDKEIKISDDLILKMAELSNGDIRFALNSLEIAINLTDKSGQITPRIVESVYQRTLKYDKKGDEHYNIISAVHKSLRSSNATAACYWITRMLQAGEDPLYIARRLLRFASEDIGNVNPNALLLANQVYETCHKLGMPECDTALMQLAEYLAKSPKSNKSYVASHMAKEDVAKYGNLPVPMHFRNAPTKLMKDLGYGKGYEYDHDLKSKKSDQQCMPDELKDRNYFE